MAMKSIVIAMYEKNSQKIAEVCRDHDIYAFSGKESLDEYIERLRKPIRKNSYIITDEEGGTPFLAALIASADTESRIIFDVNNAVCDYMDAKIERLHMRIQEHLYRAQ